MRVLDALAGRRFSVSADGTALFVISLDGNWVVPLTDEEAARLRATWKAVVAGYLIAIPVLTFLLLIDGNGLGWGLPVLFILAMFGLPRLVAKGKPMQRAADGAAHTMAGKFSRSLGRPRVHRLIIACAALGGACMIAWILTDPWTADDPDAWRKGNSLVPVLGWIVLWLAALWLSLDLGFAGKRRDAAGDRQGSA